MATKGIKELFGETMVDAELRDKLIQDPDSAVKAGGYDLDDEEMALVKQITAEEWNDMTLENLDQRRALCLGPFSYDYGFSSGCRCESCEWCIDFEGSGEGCIDTCEYITVD